MDCCFAAFAAALAPGFFFFWSGLWVKCLQALTLSLRVTALGSMQRINTADACLSVADAASGQLSMALWRLDFLSLLASHSRHCLGASRWTWVIAAMTAMASAQMMRRDKPKAAVTVHHMLQAGLRQGLVKVSADRLLHVEESLRASYEAFPKDARGNVPPHQVLPALTRAYFSKEHGWLVRGLESPGAPVIAPGESHQDARLPVTAGGLYEVQILKDKAPELATALKDTALSPVAVSAGLSLGDISRTVAALEQLLLEESLPLLRASYFLNGLDNLDQRATEHLPPPVAESQVHEVLLSYLLLFRHGLPRNLTDSESHQRLKQRAKKTADWPLLSQFEVQALNEVIHEPGKISWAQAREAVELIATRYGRWQQSECEDMKSTLMKMDTGAGRVKLQDFHGSPKHPHYQFTEKEDYLAKAGILVEEDGGKYVLIANYLLGPSNCIASSEYFAVCCINQCETLFSQFETILQAPAAPVAQIMQAVGRLRDNSTASELQESLKMLVDDTGAVVLHSPGFRKWLHQAFLQSIFGSIPRVRYPSVHSCGVNFATWKGLPAGVPASDGARRCSRGSRARGGEGVAGDGRGRTKEMATSGGPPV